MTSKISWLAGNPKTPQYKGVNGKIVKAWGAWHESDLQPAKGRDI